MADISEEELEWIADKLLIYAEQDIFFEIRHIRKTSWNNFSVSFVFQGTHYGSYFKYEQDKEQRTTGT